MKVSNWEDVIISWANALRILEEPVTNVLDLIKSSFFVKLLNKTNNTDQEEEPYISEDDVYRTIENFLKDEYSGFRLLGYWDNYEVTLVASVFLLWSSLESPSYRTPLFELDTSLQLKVQNFIQRFLETPQHLVNRQLVMDAVLDLSSDNETEDENCDFASPPKSFSTPHKSSPTRVPSISKLPLLLDTTYEIFPDDLRPLGENPQPLGDESGKDSLEIKYSKLQEELCLKTDLLAEKSDEVKQLLDDKKDADNTIQSLRKEIENLKSALSLNVKKEQEGCTECQVLKENIATLQKELGNKRDENLKLQEEVNQKSTQLKVLLHGRTFDENRIADLKLKTNILMSENYLKCEEFKEEILSLKCDICEKGNTIEFYKDEIEFLNNCIESKKVEIKNMEADFNKINMSKDREISQLMSTIEDLNKELRKLQEQLQGDWSLNEKLCNSAYQWQGKLSPGNTANEEVARELIAIHETLEWKTLKLADLSLQIDHLKSELSNKDMLNKELHERLLFMSEKNKEISRELQSNKNVVAHLQSKISSLEFNEKRLNHEIVKKIRKYENSECELKELRKVLREKFIQIDLELDACLLRGNPNLQEILEFIDFMKEKFKETKKNIGHLTIVINELEAENAEKSSEIEMYTTKLDELATLKGNEVIEQWKRENEIFQDKLRKVESELENNMIKLQDTLDKLDQVNATVIHKNELIEEMQSEIEKLKHELKEKTQIVDCLQQNVYLYEHEKSILERKLTNMSQMSERNESDMKLERKAIEEKEIQEEAQVLEDKLLDLQSKMRTEYDEKLRSTVDDYTRKIDQLKEKVKKDCLHIEHLSSELWETSDRLLLAQQESEALRSQLKRTRSRLTEQQLQGRGIEDCHSFMWLGGSEAGNYVDELVTVTTKRMFQAKKISNDTNGDDDEDFNEQCLEDLKAGICRLPSPIARLSCPAESTRKDEDIEAFLPPPENHRKLKGSIMYRKPGPPTPGIHAARHSLPGGSEALRKGLREQNINTSQTRSRLSQLFGSITLTKPKTVPESPSSKSKKKGFFQRTFGNRENLPPKF